MWRGAGEGGLLPAGHLHKRHLRRDVARHGTQVEDNWTNHVHIVVYTPEVSREAFRAWASISPHAEGTSATCAPTTLLPETYRKPVHSHREVSALEVVYFWETVLPIKG